MSPTLAAIHAAATAQTTIDTPLGGLLLVRTARGLGGAWFTADQQHAPGPFAAPTRPDDPLLRAAAEQFRDYFAGHRDGFELPLEPIGTPFQCAVWEQLRAIAAGTTASYREVASAIGRPSATRAVGAAIGRNPLSVIVPCHRVVASDGALTGYAGGLARKQALLERERQPRRAPAASAASAASDASAASAEALAAA